MDLFRVSFQSLQPLKRLYNDRCLSEVLLYITFTSAFNDLRKSEKECTAMEHRIVWIRGHVEVYDQQGRFCFSADNEREAREELEEIA